MTGKEIAKETKSSALVANDHDEFKGKLKHVGGSRSDVWNTIIAVAEASNSTPLSPR